MPIKSTFPQVDVPKCNVLDYLFSAKEELSDSPLLIDSTNPAHSLSPRQLLQWIKRLALGLDKLGVERGDRVMIFSPNHIFVPVAGHIELLVRDYRPPQGIRYLNEAKSPLEKWVCFLPLYHAYGQLNVCLLAVKLQIPVYILKAFDFIEVLRVIQTYKVTQLQLAPPVMVLLAKRPETAQYDLSSLTHIGCGAAPLSRDLQNKVSDKFNVPINQGWGMTEVTCSGSGVPLGQGDDAGSIGMLLPNCEVKLICDNGKEAKVGEPGELYIRGPNVCLGYWRNSAATQDTISPDGWLRTGDVAVTKGNKFWIVDRKKELIKIKGLQVAPAELEAVLLNNDHVDDAAVSVVPTDKKDRHGEERPRAYISLQEHAKGKTSAHEIQVWMEAQVAKHKRLTGGISFVSTVPKSPSGKILRKTLREWAKRDVPELETRMRPRL
ncbi:MAG: hypothetical protein L6R37_007681 [Teloschistes peruensis]|nr:MAG: hypothetical protein L6R37_007681 [Teloschistes peruensis]